MRDISPKCSRAARLAGYSLVFRFWSLVLVLVLLVLVFRTVSGYAGAEQADTSGHIHGVLHTITKQVEGEISKIFFGNVTEKYFSNVRRATCWM